MLSGGWSRLGLICSAILVHTILCYSVIDIHFRSPVIPDVTTIPPGTVAPAKRLVLVVADGAVPLMSTECPRNVLRTTVDRVSELQWQAIVHECGPESGVLCD